MVGRLIIILILQVIISSLSRSIGYLGIKSLNGISFSEKFKCIFWLFVYGFMERFFLFFSEKSYAGLSKYSCTFVFC